MGAEGEMVRFGMGGSGYGRVGGEVGVGECWENAKVCGKVWGVEWWGCEGATGSGCGAAGEYMGLQLFNCAVIASDDGWQWVQRDQRDVAQSVSVSAELMACCTWCGFVEHAACRRLIRGASGMQVAGLRVRSATGARWIKERRTPLRSNKPHQMARELLASCELLTCARGRRPQRR